MKTLVIPHNIEFKKELDQLISTANTMEEEFVFIKDNEEDSIQQALLNVSHEHVWAMSLGALNLINFFNDSRYDHESYSINTLTLSSFFYNESHIIIPPNIDKINFLFGEEDYVAEYEDEDIKYIYKPNDYVGMMIENLIVTQSTLVNKNIISGCAHFLMDPKSIRLGVNFARHSNHRT